MAAPLSRTTRSGRCMRPPRRSAPRASALALAYGTMAQAPLGRADNQHAELRLVKATVEFSGERKLQVTAGLLLPDGEDFTAEIDFQKCGSD